MANNFFKNILDAHKRELEKGARLFLTAEADKVIAQAKRLTPVDTGYLRGSFFRTDVTQTNGVFGVEVVNNVKYAVPVEKGHTTRNRSLWVKGFFMLTTAMEKITQGFSDRMAAAIPRLRKK